MNKRELDLLGKVFAAEIESALNAGIPIYQTRSKLAADLAERGYLERSTGKYRQGVFVVTITGYQLTHKGRMAYGEAQ